MSIRIHQIKLRNGIYWFINTLITLLISQTCLANHTVIISGTTIIDKPTTYKNVTLDMTNGAFLIVNNATLAIENGILNGSMDKKNPWLINLTNGQLILINNTVNITATKLPADAANKSGYNFISLLKGKVKILRNHFKVDKSYTVGFLMTGHAETADLIIGDNFLTNFHGGIYLINSSHASIYNNIFSRVSFSNIFINSGYKNVIERNSILFPGNNNIGDGIDLIATDEVTLAHNNIFSGSCYSIIIIKSKNITIDGNRIINGITYAIAIMSSLGITDPHQVHLKNLLQNTNINLTTLNDNQHIQITNNYLSQNRYGVSAKNVEGLMVKKNIFIQRFHDKNTRKFWTNNHTLLQNVSNIVWEDNLYKEAFTQEFLGDNDKSSKFIEFPLYGGIDL